VLAEYEKIGRIAPTSVDWVRLNYFWLVGRELGWRGGDLPGAPEIGGGGRRARLLEQGAEQFDSPVLMHEWHIVGCEAMCELGADLQTRASAAAAEHDESSGSYLLYSCCGMSFELA
jgi:hypothetical protein